LHDQAAFLAAAQSGNPVIPVYVLDDETPSIAAWVPRRAGGCTTAWRAWMPISGPWVRAWSCGGARAMRCSPRSAETGARVVHALHHYEPWWRLAERAVAKTFDLRLHRGNFLLPPGTVTTGSGQPYKIYTPFWPSCNNCRRPRRSRHRSPGRARVLAAERGAGGLGPAADCAGLGWRLSRDLDAGRGRSCARLEAFVGRAARYDAAQPAGVPGTRCCHPPAFREISPATVWHAVAEAGGSVDVFLSELGWRDYAQNLILQCPDYGARNGREAFDALPWRDAPEELAAWQQGRTGYPIVDAGMRQLWHTGWMHNRVRMIAASFLIKHLLIDWRAGEQWFWDTLVDADYGANATNWQWVAGSGLDAACSCGSWRRSRNPPSSMPPPISANGCPNCATWMTKRFTIRRDRLRAIRPRSSPTPKRARGRWRRMRQ
jgi:deoxyribodipyrimidine photo-lyase